MFRLSLLLALLLVLASSSSADDDSPPGVVVEEEKGHTSPSTDVDNLFVSFWINFEGYDNSYCRLASPRRSLNQLSKTRREKRGDPLYHNYHTTDLNLCEDHVKACLQVDSRMKLRVESRWLNAISVDIPLSDSIQIVEQLKSFPFVKSVSPVKRGTRKLMEGKKKEETKRQQSQFGDSEDWMRVHNLIDLLEDGAMGSGVIVAVLDTGFQVTHPATSNVQVLDTFDFIDKDQNVAKESGDHEAVESHGTAILGLLAGFEEGRFSGVARGIRVMLARTEDTEKEVIAEEDYYIAALEWAEEGGADIVTASIGYSDWYTAADANGKSTLSQAVDTAVKKGITVVNANGNDQTFVTIPADSELVISVGAITLSTTLSSFSSTFPTADGRIKPEVVATGEDISVPNSDGGYAQASGTSISAPIVAGIIALALEKKNWNPSQVRHALLFSSSKSSSPSSGFGWGLVDAEKFLSFTPFSSGTCPSRCNGNGSCNSSARVPCSCDSTHYNFDCSMLKSGQTPNPPAPPPPPEEKSSKSAALSSSSCSKLCEKKKGKCLAKAAAFSDEKKEKKKKKKCKKKAKKCLNTC